MHNAMSLVSNCLRTVLKGLSRDAELDMVYVCERVLLTKYSLGLGDPGNEFLRAIEQPCLLGSV
jgi:hypothetical protein